MAIATGSQIRPELSAVDYTPFLQASGQAAQMQAQGIANFASGVTQGIQNFLKKKEEKQNLEDGITLIKRFDPSISTEAARAGYKAAGGAPAFLKLKQDYAQSELTQKVNQKQLDEMTRSADENKKLDEAMRASSTPVVSQEISAGVPFEKLSTGQAAFTKPKPSVIDFMARADAAGISPSVWGKTALLLSQVEENMSSAEAKRNPKPGIEQLRFNQQVSEKESAKRVENRANIITLGESGKQLLNPEEERQARVLASTQSEKANVKSRVEEIDPKTNKPVTYDITTNINGVVISKTPVNPPNLTPEEQARAVDLSEQARDAVKYVSNFSDNVSASNVRLARNETALGLLESGNVKTGPGTPFLQGARRLMANFGGDPKTIQDAANYGVVANILGDQLISYFQKTKGAISDYETKYFSSLAANPSKTKEENIAIIKIGNAIDKRTIAANEAFKQQRKSNPQMSSVDKREFIENYINENPLDFKSFGLNTDPVVDKYLKR
jgi:hypothetical protein